MCQSAKRSSNKWQCLQLSERIQSILMNVQTGYMQHCTVLRRYTFTSNTGPRGAVRWRCVPRLCTAPLYGAKTTQHAARCRAAPYSGVTAALTLVEQSLQYTYILHNNLQLHKYAHKVRPSAHEGRRRHWLYDNRSSVVVTFQLEFQNQGFI